MIEVLSDMPAGVTGFRVSGRLSGAELRDFRPVFDGQLERGDDVRIVEVIDHDYEGFGPGGLAEDLKLGFGTVYPHHAAFKRIAIVTDKDWIAHTLHALAWLVPGECAVFGLDDLEQAKQWAAG
ncbi:STAS/SEC14 domain-containing protein [Mycobacterium sp. M26]|uniref:STAS/SEC14 domain-containing protein n=1 Tax=Mycobacterium sp. M26 TaxID=1762962 RepID=UPI00073F1D79|nr:STAS/SEC14 domain-containing protein [Mycobacterium sp. M26]